MTLQTLTLSVPSFEVTPSTVGSLGRRWWGEVERRRALRAARKGRPVVLGSTSRPFDSVAGRELLAALQELEGSTIRCIVERVPAEQVEALRELDLRHAVRVDVVCRSREESPRALAELRRLADQGLETRLLLCLGLRPEQQSPTLGDHTWLSDLARGIRLAGGSDLGLDGVNRGATHPWSEAVTLQRLRHELPKIPAGRG